MSAERDAERDAERGVERGVERGMFYVFHGDQEFLRAQDVARLKAQIVQDGMGELNITTLDGHTTSIAEIIHIANTVPFLTDRRLIIVENLLQRMEGRPRRGRSRAKSEDQGEEASGLDAAPLVEYVGDLPPFTRLLFVEDRALKPSNPLLKQAEQLPNGYVRAFKAPAAGELPAWISRRAREKDATIERSAASLLASFVGDDLRALDMELEKLSAYVNGERAINAEDVRLLVSAAQETNIFDLVDLLGLRQGKPALDQLRALLAGGANELYLLAMISRQIRLIISVKELAQEEGLDPAAIRRECKISHQFIVDKLLRQAEQFHMDELEAIMRRLVEIDEAIKTGRISGGMALEMLTLEICTRTTPLKPHHPKSVSRTR
jgi:DNA polymerase III subunit delta